jgi:predicted double-glycine peptidase
VLGVFGGCGFRALATILKNADIKTTFNKLLKLLNILKKQSGYQLIDEDLAMVCDHYNLNLLII